MKKIQRINQTMIFVSLGSFLIVTILLHIVISSTRPGELATDTDLSRTIAGATIKGYCSTGSACEYDAGGCPSNDGVTCNAAVLTKVCGKAQGSKNQTCTSDPESPYLCVTDLPTQTCASLDTRCEQSSGGCGCSTVFGGVVPAWGGSRTVC